MTTQQEGVLPQPPAQAEPLQEAAASTTTNVLTAEDVKRLVLEALETSKRAEQSQRDKMEARITANLQRTLEDLKVLGVTPDDAQLSALRKQAVEQARRDDQAQPAPKKTEQPEEEGDDDPLMNDIIDIFKEIGVAVEENDPEAARIKRVLNTGTPRQILKAAEEAAREKLARVGKAAPAPAQQIHQPPTVLAGTNAPAVNREAMANELAELIKHPSPANLERMRILREKIGSK